MIYIALPLTLLLYALTKKMYAFRRIPLLNPVLIPCILIIILLISADLSLEDYQTGTSALTFLLEPSIVALAIPLYLQFKEIKKQAVLILLCCLLSVFISVTSAVFICHFLGIDRMIAYALTTRSITTPLAISATTELGGIPSIAVAIVCIAGICGAVMGFPLMKRLKITDPRAQGLAIGSCSHAVGTSSAQEYGVVQGSYSSLALILCGIITSVVAPPYIIFLYSLLD